MKPVPHVIESDGKTVWVNGPNGAIGRFGVNGIDVHQPITPGDTKGECLHCTHARTTRADWDVFVTKMREHHGVEVTAEHMPKRLV